MNPIKTRIFTTMQTSSLVYGVHSTATNFVIVLITVYLSAGTALRHFLSNFPVISLYSRSDATVTCSCVLTTCVLNKRATIIPTNCRGNLMDTLYTILTSLKVSKSVSQNTPLGSSSSLLCVFRQHSSSCLVVKTMTTDILLTTRPWQAGPEIWTLALPTP